MSDVTYCPSPKPSKTTKNTKKRRTRVVHDIFTDDPEDPRLTTEQARILRNRLSAKRCREAARKHKETMEQENSTLKSEVAALKAENELLKQRLAALEQRNAVFPVVPPNESTHIAPVVPIAAPVRVQKPTKRVRLNSTDPNNNMSSFPATATAIAAPRSVQQQPNEFA